MSIHQRLILGLLGGMLLLFAASGTLLYGYLRTVLTSQFDAALAAKAHALSGLIKQESDGSLELDFSADSLPEFGPRGRSDYFQVWRADGTSLQRSASLAGVDLAHDIGMTAGVRFTDVSLPDGRPGRSVEFQVVPVAEENENEDQECLGPPPAGADSVPSTRVRLVVAQDRSELERTLRILFSSLVGVAVLLAAATLAIVTVAVRIGLSPLEQVAHQAAALAPESLDIRFPTAGLPGELLPICRQLNESLARLQAAFQRERRFTADVAHELRTPIAELRALADVALKWEGDPETSASYFRDVQEIACQMEKTIGTLLALARCQSGALALVPENLVLDDLVQEAWSFQREQAASRNLAVRFDIPASLVLETDRTLLAAMVANLLANAVEYTPRGGSINVRAEASGSETKLVVSNDADSLCPADLAFLFEPFWRKDPARTDSSHSGLGLALVATYADVLGGRVEAQLERDGRLGILLAFPNLEWFDPG